MGLLVLVLVVGVGIISFLSGIEYAHRVSAREINALAEFESSLAVGSGVTPRFPGDVVERAMRREDVIFAGPGDDTLRFYSRPGTSYVYVLRVRGSGLVLEKAHE